MDDDIYRAIHHDLQEPIRTAITQSEIIEKDCPIEGLDIIKDNLKWINRLIESLLRYMQIGIIDETKEELEVGDIVDLALSSLKSLIDEREADIFVFCSKVKIMGNDVLIHRLFQNLIHNALKYSTRISIECTDLIEYYEFAVQDNGIGIDESNYEFIFKPFARLQRNGTGIGLAECKKIVELHGGSIWVESKIGNGSTFYFTLPKG